MTNNINAIVTTIEEAIFAANHLKKTVFLKQFPGFSKNTKLRAESQAEDHLIAENEIPVYTPNLNGAPLAKKNSLMIIE